MILHCIENKKPIVSLCISPTLIAKSLENTEYTPKLTLGSKNEDSEYNIEEMHQAITSIGAEAHNKSVNEICVDENLKIITAPCYMMNADIKDIYCNVKTAIDKLTYFL